MKKTAAFSVAAIAFSVAAAAPVTAFATQDAYVQLSCTGGTSGTCTVSARGGGLASGSATAFHWRGTDISIVPTGPTTATFSCPSHATPTGYITAFTGRDGQAGEMVLSASTYIVCLPPEQK